MDKREKLIEKIIEGIYAIRHKIHDEMLGFFSEIQVTPAQWQIMHMVKKNKGISIKELAVLLGITSSAVTQLVDIMVNKGLILRKSNPEDRRALTLELSSKSREEFNSIKNRVFKILSSLFGTLEDDELLKYFEINNKIVAGMDTKGYESKGKME